MLPPLNLPENVPVAPRENVTVIVIWEPDIVPLPDAAVEFPSGLRPVTEALTFVPSCCKVIRQLFPLAQLPQYVPDTDVAFCAITSFAINASTVPPTIDARRKDILPSLSLRSPN